MRSWESMTPTPSLASFPNLLVVMLSGSTMSDSWDSRYCIWRYTSTLRRRAFEAANVLERTGLGKSITLDNLMLASSVGEGSISPPSRSLFASPRLSRRNDVWLPFGIELEDSLIHMLPLENCGRLKRRAVTGSMSVLSGVREPR